MIPREMFNQIRQIEIRTNRIVMELEELGRYGERDYEDARF